MRGLSGQSVRNKGYDMKAKTAVADFWSAWAGGPQFGSPLYYRPHLERFPERTTSTDFKFAYSAGPPA